MGTEEAALLAAVLGDPDDDLPRLALADWWEENGQSDRAEFVRVQVALDRAEFVRVQVALEEDRQRRISRKHAPKGFRRAALRAREVELHWRSWNLWAPGGVRWHGPPAWGFEWRRGFIRAASCATGQWLGHGDALVAAHPVEEVTLTTVPPQAWRAETLLREAWPRVRHWHLPPERIEPSRTHGAPWQTSPFDTSPMS